MSGLWLIIAGFFGMTAIGAGAFGWHSLGGDEALRQIFMMGVDYHMWHALALVGLSWLASRPELATSRLPTIAGIAFSLGIFLFSGSLYIFVLKTDLFITGAAPVGGFLMMAGWAALSLAGWQLRKPSS